MPIPINIPTIQLPDRDTEPRMYISSGEMDEKVYGVYLFILHNSNSSPGLRAVIGLSHFCFGMMKFNFFDLSDLRLCVRNAPGDPVNDDVYLFKTIKISKGFFMLNPNLGLDPSLPRPLSSVQMLGDVCQLQVS